jgi:hypothetical protein
MAAGSIESIKVDGKRGDLPSGSYYVCGSNDDCPICGCALVDADIGGTGMVAAVCPRCSLWFS